MRCACFHHPQKKEINFKHIDFFFHFLGSVSTESERKKAKSSETEMERENI